MKMKVLSGPQVYPGGRPSTRYIFIVGQVESLTEGTLEEKFDLKKGEIYPVLVSVKGTKDIPEIGEIADVSLESGPDGTELVYRR